MRFLSNLHFCFSLSLDESMVGGSCLEEGVAWMTVSETGCICWMGDPSARLEGVLRNSSKGLDCHLLTCAVDS